MSNSEPIKSDILESLDPYQAVELLEILRSEFPEFQLEDGSEYDMCLRECIDALDRVREPYMSRILEDSQP